MARLSKAEQEDYKEELEYAYGGDAFQRGYQRGVDNRKTPVNRSSEITHPQKTVVERISGAIGKVAAVSHDFGQNPHIRQISGQSGFSSQSPRPAPRTRQPAYPEDQPRGPSGGSIHMTICDEYGNCKTKTIKGGPSKPRQPRRPGWAEGTLGGHDPGFL